MFINQINESKVNSKRGTCRRYIKRVRSIIGHLTASSSNTTETNVFDSAPECSTFGGFFYRCESRINSQQIWTAALPQEVKPLFTVALNCYSNNMRNVHRV